MDFNKLTKEQKLLVRLFKLIEYSHFKDFKLSVDYVESVSMPRQLGTEIGNYVQSNFPEYYHGRRKKIESQKHL